MRRDKEPGVTSKIVFIFRIFKSSAQELSLCHITILTNTISFFHNMFNERCIWGRVRQEIIKVSTIKANYQGNTKEHCGKGTWKTHDWGHSLFTHVLPCQPKVSKRGFKMKLTSHFLPNGFILFLSNVFYLQNLTVLEALLSLESYLIPWK